MPRLPIGDISPCFIFWDYGDTVFNIGPYLGKVSLHMTDAINDVYEEVYGDAPVDAVFSGSELELSVPMTRSTLVQLAETIGYRNMGSLSGPVLTLKNVEGCDMYEYAKQIVIVPSCNNIPNPDPSTWTLLFKCHPYRDFEVTWDKDSQRIHMVKFKVFPNYDDGYCGEFLQEGVVCPPASPLLTRRYLDTARFVAYKALCIFEDKLCIWDHGPNLYDGQVLCTEDGESWSTLFSRTAAEIGSSGDKCGNGIAVYNGNLFITKYWSTPAPRPRVIEWDGASVTLHLNPPPPVEQDNYMASNLVVWDNKLWVLTDVTPFISNDRRVVYYYDGASWTAITDYGGVAYLNYFRAGSASLPTHAIKHRCTRLFVFKNELYLMATRYTGAKWVWEVWKFDATAYDNFTKIYDSDAFDDGYALAAIIEFEGNVKIVGNKLATNGNPGVDGKLYTSSDMENWTLEATQAGMGFPYGEELFQPSSGECLVPAPAHKFYLNCVNAPPGDNRTWIRHWDEGLGEFVLDQEITTNTDMKGGGLKVFGNGLFAGKWKEVYANSF